MNKLILSVCALSLMAAQAIAQSNGDAQQGRALVETCTVCHGADGNSVVGMWPNLAGQGEKYLLKQMIEIKNGVRPVPTMAGLLDNLSEKDLRDIAAFYAGQPVQIGAAKPEFVDLGQRIYRAGVAETGVAACTACHSPTGVGNAPALYPALGGQHAEYIATQLRAFRSGERINDGESRIMRDIALRMNDNEIDAVASYISGLH